jgi:DNA-directed RNA polymerase subunit E'/Rpb7
MDIKSAKKRKDNITSIYNRALLTRNITLPISNIGTNLKETLEQFISFHYEGKCIVEGFVKSQSTKIVTFSSGEITRGNMITFVVTFECEICYPVEGMIISCIAQNITKAGIKAGSADETPSPIVVFVAKDHNFNNEYFSQIKIDEIFNIRVIGQRFELNDDYVSVLGEITRPVTLFKDHQKPKILIED